MDHVPPATVADPVRAPSMSLVRLTTAPFSPDPLIVSPVSVRVILSVLELPVSSALSRSSPVGALAKLSVTMTSGVEAVLVFPATSVALAVMLWEALSEREISNDHVPPATTAEPARAPSTLLVRVTVEPFSPVPLIVSPVSVCVMLSVLEDPVSSALARLSAAGTVGSVLSTVSHPAKMLETLPAGSTATIS